MKQTFTKSIILTALVFLIIGTNPLCAQTDSESVKTISKPGKYLVKINLLGIPLNNYSFQFERAIAKKIAFGLGVRYAPNSGLPLSSQVERIIDDPKTWNQLKNFKTGNLAISPEIRFYMGKGIFRGFYLAPFARYAKYTAEAPINFDVPSSTGGASRSEIIPLSGDLTTLTGGLLLGVQWKLSKAFYLDWSILGPQYGTSKGSISGKKSLDADEQTALKSELQNLEDLPMLKTTYTVDNNGAKVDLKGPWAGVRSSFSLGVRF